MNSGFGGAQPFMRKDSIVVQTDGYLGPHDAILSVGMAQSMVFLPTDFGPFWMTVAERNARQSDRPKANAATPKPRNKSKKDLSVEFSTPGNVLDPTKCK
jgi:hypothetical protein